MAESEFETKSKVYTVWERDVRFTPLSCCWLAQSSRLVVCGESPSMQGCVQVVTADQQSVTHFRKVGSGIRSADCSSTVAGVLFTGHSDGTVRMWDVPKQHCVSEWVHSAEDCAHCLSVSPGELTEFTVGFDRGRIGVFDPRLQRGCTLECSMPDSGAVWSLSMANCLARSTRSVVSGTESGRLAVRELRRMDHALSERELGEPVTAVQTDSLVWPSQSIVVGTVHSSIKVAGYKSDSLHTTKLGECGTVWSVQHCPHRRSAFISATGAGTVQLWAHSDSGVTQNCDAVVSTQPVNDWRWHPNKAGLACACSLDQRIRLLCVTQL